MFPRYHPHCIFLSGFPGENAHSFILNAYHGSAYLISCSDLMFSRPAPECSPLYVSSMLMLSVGDIGFLSDSAYGVSFTAFFILCIIAQQFCICKHRPAPVPAARRAFRHRLARAAPLARSWLHRHRAARAFRKIASCCRPWRLDGLLHVDGRARNPSPRHAPAPRLRRARVSRVRRQPTTGCRRHWPPRLHVHPHQAVDDPTSRRGRNEQRSGGLVWLGQARSSLCRCVAAAFIGLRYLGRRRSLAPLDSCR